MPNTVIRTISRWRFERPLALLLAAAAVFAAAESPALIGHPVRWPAAIGFGLALGVIGWWTMRPRTARPVTEEDEAELGESGELAAHEVSVRLRRADRHPDAPARDPIFAARDLGKPMMEIEPETAAKPATTEAIVPHEAEISAVADETVEPVAVYPVEDAQPEPIEPITEPEPAAVEAAAEPEIHEDAPVEPIVEVAEDTVPAEAFVQPVMPAEDEETPHGVTVAAFAPADEPAPAPARAPRQSLAAMMDRLSAGLEQRAQDGAERAPRAPQPALRDALDELNRLAARRG